MLKIRESELEPELESRVRAILNRWPAVGLALGVVSGGSLQYFRAHGLADVAAQRPVDVHTVFRIGSITKTFTAIAVLQLWEQGLVDLDAPVADYLRAYPLMPAEEGFRPATVRHLLTHTGGISEQVPPRTMLRADFGESVPGGRPVPTLAEFYAPGLPVAAEPGTRFRYTDHGPATLGQVVEDVTGVPFDRYLREHLFDPLGMTHTDLIPSDRVRDRLATGYRLTSRGPRPVPESRFIPAGAGAAYSSPADMARYLAALCGGGTNEHGTVLRPASLATMFAPQYQPDPRLPGIGFAFFRAGAAGHTVVEHQGVLPGFDSQVFVAPDDDAAVMVFATGARGAVMWLPAQTGRLLNHLIGVPDEGIRTDVPQHPEVWEEICGWYALPGPLTLTDARIRVMTGAAVEVTVRRGHLVLRVMSPVPALLRGLRLHADDPTDPYLFRIDLTEHGLGSLRIAFGRERPDGPMSAHLDGMPLTVRQRPHQRPRPH